MITINSQLLLFKKNKLQEIKKRLKQKFVGIDEVIDTLISSITNWYLTPQLMLRPNIVCLWGITGVGKTDLIRTLVKELKMLDVYVQIQFNNSQSMKYKNIRDSLYSSDLDCNTPGILLLDQIQRFRTIDENGHQIQSSGYTDLWQLLSDGRFSTGVTSKADIVRLIQDIISDYQYHIAKGFNGCDEDELIENEIDVTEIIAKVVGKTLDSEVVQQNKPTPYKLSTWYLYKIKRMVGNKYTMQQLVSMNVDNIIKLLQDMTHDQSLLEIHPYNKLLVIISGNLDQAYHFASWAEQADMDADIIHKYSNEVDMIQIKSALGRRFKPQQISRFGNNHIIYRTLNKESYRILIERKLQQLNVRLMEQIGIKINWDDSLKKLIYDNGVFPCQGVRPLFSTISVIVQSNLPEFLIYSLKENVSQFTLSFVDDKLVSQIKDISISTSVRAAIDQIRKKRTQSNDKKRLVATHEAGHALLFAVNYNTVPQQITIRTSGNSEGFVYTPRKIDSKHHMTGEIETLLAGSIAERIIFKQQSCTTGATWDLRTATRLAAQMKRKFAMSNSLSVYQTDGLQLSKQYNTSMKQTNEQIQKQLQECAQKAKNKIINNIGLFIDISNELYNNLEISCSRFYQICISHGLHVKMYNKEQYICHEYNDMWNKFVLNSKQNK